MAKAYKIMDGSTTSDKLEEKLQTDWNKSILCQEVTTEVLQCPAESTRDQQGAGYTTIADLLQGFSDIGCLPKSLDLTQLDDGEGIETTLKQHKGKWHDLCRLQYNRTQLQRAAKRTRPVDAKCTTSSKKRFTRKSIEQASCPSIETCFFCNKPASGGETLRRASTFGIDLKVCQCATILQDEQLLVKLSAGDLIAQDASYHLECLVFLYNRAREKNSPTNNTDEVNEGIAFAELVSYIEDCQMDTLVAPIFKLKDLVNLYSTRLTQLGTDILRHIHSTKLKDRILSYFQDMEAHKKG